MAAYHRKAIQLNKITINSVKYRRSCGIRIFAINTHKAFAHECFNHSKVLCIYISTPAPVLNIFRMANKMEYIFNNRESCIVVGFGHKILHQRFQLACFVHRNRSMQRVYLSVTPHVRQTVCHIRYANDNLFDSVIKIGGHPHFADIANSVVIINKGRDIADKSFCSSRLIYIGIVQVNGFDMHILERLQFALIRNPVTVFVNPQSKLIKYFIVFINYAVVIGIILCKGFKAVLCF